ncbi:thyroxine 5-deiodinase-like [Ptychodera flava]|uniref:thyroxine 5-deiodinase-like n=1 Tax=Ptychodera flava TaxID=63121 RepID=UPI00396A303E
MVYQPESHPKNGWSMGSHLSLLDQHKTLEERREAARLLMELDTFHTFTTDLADQTKVRLVLDNMEKSFSLEYDSYPSRAFIINEGKAALIGRTIDDQIKPRQTKILMTDELRKWLKKHCGSSLCTVL